jgi:hypothetical protein
LPTLGKIIRLRKRLASSSACKVKYSKGNANLDKFGPFSIIFGASLLFYVPVLTVRSHFSSFAAELSAPWELLPGTLVSLFCPLIGFVFNPAVEF